MKNRLPPENHVVKYVGFSICDYEHPKDLIAQMLSMSENFVEPLTIEYGDDYASFYIKGYLPMTEKEIVKEKARKEKEEAKKEKEEAKNKEKRENRRQTQLEQIKKLIKKHHFTNDELKSGEKE